MNVLEILFWLAVLLIAYSYAGFPALTLLRGVLMRRPYQTGDITPSVTLIIAAHNEADVIEAKLQNVLSLDYPADCLNVVIASDGSTDGTNEIVQRYVGERVTLLALPRQGKAPALDAAVKAATGDILVFSDANSMYAPQAIREIVRPFADPSVGGVAGNQVYLDPERGTGGDGEKMYWNFDRLLKEFQSRAGNVTSATGAIYAIRRELYQPVIGGVTDDFYISTGVIAQHRRLVFSADAIAYEAVAGETGKEFNRKVRITTRGLQAVLSRRELLNPFQHGFYSLQLLSHKVLRRLAVLPLIVVFVLSPLLWAKGWLYRLALLGQLAFYGLAALGALLENTRLGQKKPLAIPYYFCMVNAACLVAAANIVRGRRIERWDTERSLPAAETPGTPAMPTDRTI